MITQRLGIVQSSNWAMWRIHVDTGSSKKTGIPINLHDQPGVTVKVDWGDGSSSILTASDYGMTDARASVHSYETDGVYEVIIYISGSESLYLHYEGNTIYSETITNTAIFNFRKTLISVDSAIPLIAGVKRVWRSKWQYASNALFRFFLGCEKLTTLSVDTFYNNPLLTDVSYQFYETPLITDFTLRFSSPNINFVEEFCSNSSDANRIIYVPSGSTTETTFTGIASSKHLTIIGE